MKNILNQHIKNPFYNKNKDPNNSSSNDSYFDDKDDEFILEKELKTSKNVNTFLKRPDKGDDNLDKLNIIEKTKDNHFAKVK
jgi:hypothetical protein